MKTEEKSARKWWKRKEIIGAAIGCLVVAVAALLAALRLGTAAQDEWKPVDMKYRGYQKIIFAGDSRTVHMEKLSAFDDVEFVGLSGKGLKWFQEEGYGQLLQKVEENDSPMPTAVVFNLGVNDYRNRSDEYIVYFKDIAKELKNKNCYLFYMSVNPVESRKLTKSGLKPRYNKGIRQFNRALKEGLKEDYTWLAVDEALEKKGYTTRDGLHFRSGSYIYILSEAVQMVLDSGAYSQDYCWRQKGGDWHALRWEDSVSVKNAWIRDGEGEFCLDGEGRLLRSQELPDQQGQPCAVGATGRRQCP